MMASLKRTLVLLYRRHFEHYVLDVTVLRAEAAWSGPDWPATRADPRDRLPRPLPRAGSGRPVRVGVGRKSSRGSACRWPGSACTAARWCSRKARLLRRHRQRRGQDHSDDARPGSPSSATRSWLTLTVWRGFAAKVIRWCRRSSSPDPAVIGSCSVDTNDRQQPRDEPSRPGPRAGSAPGTPSGPRRLRRRTPAARRGPSPRVQHTGRRPGPGHWLWNRPDDAGRRAVGRGRRARSRPLRLDDRGPRTRPGGESPQRCLRAGRRAGAPLPGRHFRPRHQQVRDDVLR